MESVSFCEKELSTEPNLTAMYLSSNKTGPLVAEMQGGSTVGDIDGAEEIEGANVFVKLVL